MKNDIKDIDKPEATDRLAIAFLSAGFGILSSRSTPIECQHCDGLSATRPVTHSQFIIGVIYLAIFPNLLLEATLHVADIAVLAVIFMIKLIAPMTESSVVG